jgi:hypothetical protein
VRGNSRKFGIRTLANLGAFPTLRAARNVHNGRGHEIDGISSSWETQGEWIMDDRLRQRIGELTRQLAIDEQERLAGLGTFVEIEDLTAEIGDELTRQLARIELSRRAEEMAQAETRACPECGREAPVDPELEPLILKGLRGELEYSEPVCRCTRCRVSFFPSGRRLEAPAS